MKRSRTAATVRSRACLGLAAALLFGAGQAGAAIDAPQLYHDFCSVCHGDSGDGDSRAKGSLVPPPRDFTTPQASIDLDRERMVRSITEGIPGTAMTAWKHQLSADEIAAIVDYVRDAFMMPATTASHDETGRRIYAEYCSVCHGDRGDGRSHATSSFDPPPRDFTSAASQRDLDRERMIFAVAYGVANTAMAGWESQLSRDEIESVVDFVRRRFMALDDTPPPDATAAAGGVDVARFMAEPYAVDLTPDVGAGGIFYNRNCAACHGAAGDGDGPRAYFILPRPRDFRHPAARHGLNRPNLYHAIAKGVLGSEMPAWDKVLTPQQIVDVAEYVFQGFIWNDAARREALTRSGGEATLDTAR